MATERNWKTSQRRKARQHQSNGSVGVTDDGNNKSVFEFSFSSPFKGAGDKKDSSNSIITGQERIGEHHPGLEKIIQSIDKRHAHDNDEGDDDRKESLLDIHSEFSSDPSECLEENVYYNEALYGNTTHGEEEEGTMEEDDDDEKDLLQINSNNQEEEEDEIEILDKEFEEAEGPIIYATQDDSDSVSQITSSVAGSLLYQTSSSINGSQRFSNERNHFITNRLRTDRSITNKMKASRYESKNSGSTKRESIISSTATAGPVSTNSVSSKGSLDDLYEVAMAETSGLINRSKNTTHHEAIKEEEDDEEDGSLSFSNINLSDIETNTGTTKRTSVSSKSFKSKNSNDNRSIGRHRKSNTSPSVGNFIVENTNTMLSRTIKVLEYIQHRYVSSKKKKDDDHDDENNVDYFGTFMSGLKRQPTPSSPSNPYSEKGGNRCIINVLSIFTLFVIMTAAIVLMRMSSDDDPSMKDKLKGNQVIMDENVVIEQGIRGNIDINQNMIRFIEGATSKRHVGMELPALFEGFADVDQPYNKQSDLPFFWHVPRTGGTTMNDILVDCLQLTVASNSGVFEGHGDDVELQVVHFDRRYNYVNVDLSTMEGIERAKKLSMVSSGIANVAVSSLLYEAAAMFSEINKGRMFALFRHPVERAVSLFHYLQDTQWRRSSTKNLDLANIKIEEFFKGGLAENNWMTRFLSNQLTKGQLEESDLDLAKEVLRRKCLVGLLKEKGQSFARFEKYFGWKVGANSDSECHEKKLQWAWPLKHRHEEVEEGTELWDLVVRQNEFDMELYEYSKILFMEQEAIFSSFR